MPNGDEENPDQLSPPVVGKVGHFSVELSWDQDYQDENASAGKGRRHYSLQEEEVGKQRGFGNVYRYWLIRSNSSNSSDLID